MRRPKLSFPPAALRFRAVHVRVTALVLSTLLSSIAYGAQRPLTPVDLFRIEEFGDVVASPAGDWLAYVRIRGKAVARFHMRDFMNGLDRADIWVVPYQGGRPRNLTQGAVDSSGWFAPSWSPDGRRLAMLSTRGNKIRLWEWELGHENVRLVSSEVMQMETPVWLSRSELLCASAPDGRNPEMFTMEVGAAQRAMSMWPESWRGEAPTVSVLSSGLAEMAKRNPGHLWRFDLVQDKAIPVLEGNFSDITPSPDGTRIAMLEVSGRVHPEPQQLLPNRNPILYRLVVLGDPKMHAEDVVPGSLRWSRIGTLILQSHVNRRASDWTVVAGPTLTASFQTPPAKLVPMAEGDAFGAVAGGHLWLLQGDGAPPHTLDDGFGKAIDSLVWADGSVAVVSAAGQLFTVDLKAAAFRPLALPAANAAFKTFLPQANGAVSVEETHEGTYLSSPRGKLASINTFLAGVSEGQMKKLEYRSLTGDPLIAWVLLPPGYVKGQRYPSVVWVYGGLTYSATPPSVHVRLSGTGPFNLQLLAARGYAVILPSMPLEPEGRPSDPYQALPNGVLPAVDKAIELGITDPQRLALMGQSYGGYGVYGLVTQTSRFQAAVALAGFCDLISLYGAIDARFRYDDDARDHLLHMVLTESGQFRMGVPPWKDTDRYIRNSPLTYADKVTTPLMIVQGDMDYVPIQQGEEFFTALYRQNKPASFVRYWGEGHTLESPANITDFWARLYAWLERYL